MGKLAAILSRFRALLGARGGRDDLGRRGEEEAARLLRAAGCTILGRNLRLPFGEIDLLAEDRDGRTIILVEVKSRRRAKGAPRASAEVAPEASITARKARTLVRLLDAVIAANGWRDRPRRIDVIAVEFFEGAGGERCEARHYRAAVGRR